MAEPWGAHEPLVGSAMTVLSSGFGVQSTTLALLAVEGVLPKPDAVISSDTGWEPADVYAHLDRLTPVLTSAMRDERPEEWAEAVAFDRAIRCAPKGSRSGIRGEQYLHRSLLPLDQAPIDVLSRRELRRRQVDLVELLLDDEAEAEIAQGCSPYGCRSGAA